MLLWACCVASQATVTVVSADGTENRYSVDTTGEIFFGTDYMAIMTTASATNLATFLMDDVSKVLFDVSVRIVDVSESNPLTLTPNPAAESFVLHGLGDGPQTVTVYGINGSAVLQGSYSDGEPIEIGSLPQGIYIVRAAGSIVKLIKR